MGLQIEKKVVVRAPRAAVWDFLVDPHRVARCLPGAAITEKIDDSKFAGTMTIKVGPVTASYRGKLAFDRLDATAGEADLSASGQETRGKGGADMRMKSRLVALSPMETEVTVVSDVNVFGILAQMGRGLIQDVSDQMFQKFSDAMRRELEVAAPAMAPAAATAAAPAAAAHATEIATASAAAPSAAVAASPAGAPPGSEGVLDLGQLGAAASGRAALRAFARPSTWIILVLLGLLLYCWCGR
jgi:uncharacterized protein